MTMPAMPSSDFYRAFEDVHRGPRSLIQQRLQVYLPYVEPLLQLYPPAPAALDLGCGRGEWIELLQTAGFAPQGVDLDEGMLVACRQLSLPAVQGDALVHLRALGDASQAIVSGFHIAEHISFDDLQTLVSEALRVLQPGGLLILETPNPENIVVGSCSFYLDPTHLRPLPPKLLSFLPEHLGYARVKVVRLQEDSRLASSQRIQLIDVLAGVSPDYAVIAQKTAPINVMQAFDAAFELVHGIELEVLAQRFDNQILPPLALEDTMARIEAQLSAQLVPLREHIDFTDARLQAQISADLSAQLEPLREQIDRADARLQAQISADLSAQLEPLREQIDRTDARLYAQISADFSAQLEPLREQINADLSAQLAPLIDHIARADHLREAAQARALAAEAECNALRHSLSWRITAGPRAIADWGARLNTPVTLARTATKASQRVLVPLIRTVLQNPRLSRRLNQVLLRLPALHQRLVGVARQGGLFVDLQVYDTADLPSTPPSCSDLAALTPEARKIYRQFKVATEHSLPPSKERT